MACTVQLAIDLAIEAALYFATGTMLAYFGPISAILVVFMLAVAVADTIDNRAWSRQLFTDKYLKEHIDMNNSQFFMSKGQQLIDQLNVTIFKFISGNFKQEKAETEEQLSISFKYFYDTSVGKNTIPPKLKSDKTIDPDLKDPENLILNNPDQIYDHLKISKNSHSQENVK